MKRATSVRNVTLIMATIRNASPAGRGVIAVSRVVNPLASGSTQQAAKCFGSKRERRTMQTALALPDFQFLDRQAPKSCAVPWIARS
jgi:hypothetical protein